MLSTCLSPFLHGKLHKSFKSFHLLRKTQSKTVILSDEDWNVIPEHLLRKTQSNADMGNLNKQLNLLEGQEGGGVRGVLSVSPLAVVDKMGIEVGLYLVGLILGVECVTPTHKFNEGDRLLLKGVVERNDEFISEWYYKKWRSLVIFLVSHLMGLRMKSKNYSNLLNLKKGIVKEWRDLKTARRIFGYVNGTLSFALKTSLCSLHKTPSKEWICYPFPSCHPAKHEV